jgi:hypothetical protein
MQVPCMSFNTWRKRVENRVFQAIFDIAELENPDFQREEFVFRDFREARQQMG